MLPFASQQQPQAQACFSRLLDACGAHSHPGSPAMPTSLLLVNCAENRSIATIPSLTEQFYIFWDFSEKGVPLLGPTLVDKTTGGPKIRSTFRTLFFFSLQSANTFFFNSGVQNDDWMVWLRPCSDIQLLDHVLELVWMVPILMFSAISNVATIASGVSVWQCARLAV